MNNSELNDTSQIPRLCTGSESAVIALDIEWIKEQPLSADDIVKVSII
jgi:hypothetical protein